VEACDPIVISGDNAIAWVRTNRGALVAKVVSSLSRHR
jgi:hypothetical protein